MPLTCILRSSSEGTRRLDSTTVADDEWAEVHRAKPRPLLACPECGVRMHAKASRLGLRFFAHDHENSQCSLSGETPQHRYLKAALADMIRSEPGWTATIEAEPTDRDRGGWRADVLAAKGQRRVAFEVQLAPMTASVGRERTGLYALDGVDTIWVTDYRRALAPWLGHVRGLVLNYKRSELVSVPSERLRVAYGILGWVQEAQQWWWQCDDYREGTRPLLSHVVSALLVRRYKARQLYGVNVLADSSRKRCGQTALIERECLEDITTELCRIHGSPPAIRVLRKAAGLSAWGWDEERFWKDAKKDQLRWISGWSN